MTNTISRYDFEAAVENVPHRIYENYSGRGMMGSTCFGMVVESSADAGSIRSELLRAAERIREVAEEQLEFGDDDVDAWYEEQGELADALESLPGSLSSDNLGRDIIVYFPGWSFDD